MMVSHTRNAVCVCVCACLGSVVYTCEMRARGGIDCVYVLRREEMMKKKKRKAPILRMTIGAYSPVRKVARVVL